MSDLPAHDTAHDAKFTRFKARVLLVDDQLFIFELIGAMLNDEDDIEFHFVESAEAAVKTAIELKPTVILQDLTMPGLDGFQLIQKFRVQPEIMHVPVIMLSAKEDPKIKAQAFGVGASDYLVKMPNKLELVARIRYHSAAYINRLERDEAFRFLRESQQKLAEANLELRKLKALDTDLQKLAALDALTGLANRRRFDDVLRSEWARAQREKQPLSLLLSDIDQFQIYNDKHGPDDGDACVKKLAVTLSKNLKRPADLISRYSDEFAFLLPNTDSEGAMKVAEICRQSVEALNIASEGAEKKVLTLSVGVACITPTESMTHEDLVRVAARALRNSKEQGRNLVRLARHRSITAPG